MTNEELTPIDQLHYAIKGLRGWYEALTSAEDFYAQQIRLNVGRLLSSVLLTTGDDSALVAASGQLNEELTGHLLLIYQDMIVTVDASRLSSEAPEYRTSLWSIEQATDLQVEARHSFYEGTEARPRHKGFTFSFALGGERRTLRSQAQSFQSPLVQDDALLEAFKVIRSRVISS